MVGNIQFRPMTPDEIASRDRAKQIEQDTLRYQLTQAAAQAAGSPTLPVKAPQKPRAAAKPKPATQWPPKAKTPATKPRKGK
jgi:hypothetical protein